MSDRDNYGILGLTPDADGTTVNRTYWHLARKYQALAPTDPRARHLLDELNAAYAVLGTPQQREAYDATWRAIHATTPKERSRTSHRDSLVRPTRAKVSLTDEGAPDNATTGGRVHNWAPYALIGLLAASSVSLGVIAGNVVLIVAGTGGALALVAAVARHNLGRAWASIGARRATHAARADAEPAPRAREREVPRSPSALRVGRRGAPADDLQSSTASMVGRWRTSVNANGGHGGRGPDTTLVDIFQSERELETSTEPLSAVLDILRGSRDPVELR